MLLFFLILEKEIVAKLKKKLSNYMPVLIAFAILLSSVWAIMEYSEYAQSKIKKSEREKVYEMLSFKKSLLEKALYSRIYYTKGVAAYISLNPEINHQVFQDLAKELIQKDSTINTMSIAKNGIINSIYPFKGHEKAVGLNLLAHPGRREIVEKTIETHNTFVAGPVELVEGGIAFVSYTPIFYKSGKNEGSFWGITDIVVRRDNLLKEAKLYDTEGEIRYAIKGKDGLGANGEVFWGDSTLFNQNPVIIEMALPTGSWLIAAVPKNGWNMVALIDKSLIIFLYISALFISSLIGLLIKTYLKAKENERQLQAIFGAMHDIIIEYNEEGKYLNVAPTNESLLILPRKELIGKYAHDILNIELADLVVKNIRDAVTTGEVQTFDYPLEINEKLLWFQARVSKISNNRALLVSHDNTERTLAIKRLKESETELKKSNSLKDKFFSIIAHDLKSPIGSFNMLTDSLYTDFDKFSDADKKEYLELMRNSSKNLVNLIENLLQWSRSQKGEISFNPTEVNLDFLCNNVKNTLSLAANAKNIEIRNNLDSKISLNADINMLTTIFRNLISNSIKFTEEGGEIVISSKEISEANKNYVQICIADTGVGMNEEVRSKLFKLASSVSMPGTNDEKGTGLGLILCKEFVDKHGGNIWVESQEGKGSQFYFTLPL